jgi:hypothetical protein
VPVDVEVIEIESAKKARLERRRRMPTMPRACTQRPGRVVEADNEGVGVWVATNLLDGNEPDRIPIRIRVTTEDGTGSAYLSADEAYELVHVLGQAITKAKQIEREYPASQPMKGDETR